MFTLKTLQALHKWEVVRAHTHAHTCTSLCVIARQ